jgi:hypothetical protein
LRFSIENALKKHHFTVKNGRKRPKKGTYGFSSPRRIFVSGITKYAIPQKTAKKEPAIASFAPKTAVFGAFLAPETAFSRDFGSYFPVFWADLAAISAISAIFGRFCSFGAVFSSIFGVLRCFFFAG